MRRFIGFLFVLHGLAHTGAGMWASAFGPTWLVTGLWLLASTGFIAGGLGVLGVPGLRRRWEPYAVAGAAGSLLLLTFYGHLALLVGLAIDALLLALGLRVAEKAVAAPAPPVHHPLWLRVAHGAGWALLAWTGVTIAARPWMQRWGTTAAERAATLPGDERVPVAHYRIDHAVTIAAPSQAVWPWVAQLGQDQAGFYSYDWLERAFGADIHNADSLSAAWQLRRRGDLVRAVQPTYMGGIFGRDLGWRITDIEYGRQMQLEGWGAFVVQQLDDSTTRLYVRTRGPGEPTVLGALVAPVGVLVFEPAHFIMERGMLLGIKERAERGAYAGR